MEQQDPEDSKGNSLKPDYSFRGKDYYRLPSDFSSKNHDEWRRDNGLVSYFDYPSLEIQIFRHSTDLEKLSRSTYKNRTGFLAMRPMMAFTVLSLHDGTETLRQSARWNGGPLPKSEERWELLDTVESTEQSKLEELLWIKFKKVQEFNETLSLRNFAEIEHQNFKDTFGNSVNRLPIAVQWMDFLKEVSEGCVTIEEGLLKADTSTPLQESGDGAGVNESSILTLRQAAYLLAYQNAGIMDPRTDRDKKADNFAVTLCGLTSATSGQQLYTKFDKLRRAKDRESAFNGEVDKYKESDTKSPKAMKAILEDVRVIIPNLKGKEKNEAETDLSNWNRMYLDAVK
ncbi:MAG: hypothetical protein K9G46_03290 [Flavobacteriales bacterium]|nr:hypothetical protein [Flavobacteriales bacterium]